VKSRPISRPTHLLWIVPVALLVDAAFFFAALVAKCGVSGCGGGGFGVAANPGVSVALIVIAGAVTAGLLAVSPWTRSQVARICAAAIAAITTWVWLWCAVFVR